MSCERNHEALTGLAAGAPASAALEAHLGSCSRCAAELDALRAALRSADEELSALATAEPSPDFAGRLRRRVAHGEAASAASRWPGAWLAAAAVLALALAALVLWRAQARPERLRVAEGAAAAAAPSRPSVSAGPTALGPPGATPVPGNSADRIGGEAAAERSHGNAGPRPAAGSVGSRRPHRVRDRGPREAEVLVPAGQVDALLQYVALVHERKASPAVLLAAGQPSTDLPEPEMHVEPLEIAPLDPAEAEVPAQGR